MYAKQQGARRESHGHKFDSSELVKTNVRALTIAQFLNEFKIDLSVVAVGYHMRTNKIDWAQPGRERFVLLTKVTKNYYSL